MARATEHLLVLLLPHALATLLDQRTHKTEEPSVMRAKLRKRDIVEESLRGRSIGRTAGFGPVNRGSSPLPGTIMIVKRVFSQPIVIRVAVRHSPCM